MQNGSMMRTERHGGPDVWEFRWREPGPDGKRKHRRMVVGTPNRSYDTMLLKQYALNLARISIRGDLPEADFWTASLWFVP